LAPITGGFVQQHLGSTALWLGCAGLGVLVAAGQLVSGPARERRAAALREVPGATVTAPPAAGELRHDEDVTAPAKVPARVAN
jgi:hypothetical protein